jgi:hypothetical protein
LSFIPTLSTGSSPALTAVREAVTNKYMAVNGPNQLYLPWH